MRYRVPEQVPDRSARRYAPQQCPRSRPQFGCIPHQSRPCGRPWSPSLLAMGVRRPQTRHQAMRRMSCRGTPGHTTARASEVCHFAGSTDYSGRIEVTTDVNARVTDGTTTSMSLSASWPRPGRLVHIRYLMQEISTWKSDQLRVLRRIPAISWMAISCAKYGICSTAARTDWKRIGCKERHSATFGANIRPSSVTGVLRTSVSPGSRTIVWPVRNGGPTSICQLRR